MTVTFAAGPTAGVFNAVVVITSDDPVRARVEIPVQAEADQ